MDLTRAARIFFAFVIIVSGIIGFVSGNFAPIWRPVPQTVPARQALIVLTSLISLGAGAGLLVKRSAATAALTLLALLIVWTAMFKFPFIVRAPLVEGSYQSCGENAVLIAGAWLLYASAAKPRSSAQINVLTGKWGIWTARILYGLALIAFGFSHFAYLELTAPLVPSWLPGPVFWAYFSGIAYIATGVSVVSGLAARLGAVASAILIALITMIVWTPIVVAGHVTATHWQETMMSWALTAAAFVVASSYEGCSWLTPFDKLFARRKPAAA